MRWLMTLLAITVLGACSAGSSGGDQVPQRSASDLATVRAQAGLDDATPTSGSRLPTVTATAKGGQPSATVQRREQNPGLASDEAMMAALLEPRDIATTWTRSGYDGYGTLPYCGSPAIEDQFEQLGWAYGSYSAVGGQWAEQWVFRLSESDAQAAMDYARSTLTCERYTYELGGGNDIYWDLDTLQLSPPLDDAVALTMDISFQNPVPTPQFGNIIIARQGEYVVVLLHYGFRIDPAVTSTMATAAIARIGLIPDASV
jgi:hypothetical protein